jgi:hypothetical protein
MPSFTRIVRSVRPVFSWPSKREARVQLAVEVHHADRTSVPGARRLLLVLDELHRPLLGGAGDRHRPGVREEGVEGIELRP